jgi:hypothetical protein
MPLLLVQAAVAQVAQVALVIMVPTMLAAVVVEVQAEVQDMH